MSTSFYNNLKKNHISSSFVHDYFLYNLFTVTDEELRNYRSVRATVFLGILLTTAAIVTAVLVLFVLKDKTILFFVAGGLDIAAGKLKKL